MKILILELAMSIDQINRTIKKWYCIWQTTKAKNLYLALKSYKKGLIWEKELLKFYFI